MENELVIMNGAANAQVQLICWSGHLKWVCNAEATADNATIKVRGEGYSPSEAVHNCFNRWVKLVKPVPEFVPQLSAPAADDDIPF